MQYIVIRSITLTAGATLMAAQMACRPMSMDHEAARQVRFFLYPNPNPNPNPPVLIPKQLG
jgi:hypothetical protein